MLQKARFCAGIAALMFGAAANATIVQFQTSMGDFEVNLYDQTTPATVANFLKYVADGDYEDTIVHRSVKGFVIQGGGFVYDGSLPLKALVTNPAVVNEPRWSNLKATIAMAKTPDNANSATSQWFINLANNSAALDNQNGGFTVFGEVMLDGMDVVEAIAEVPVYNLNPLNSLPLRSFNSAGEETPDGSNFVMIFNIAVLDAAEDTAADAEPVPNTLVSAPRKKSSGGWGFAGLALLLSLALGKRLRRT